MSVSESSCCLHLDDVPKNPWHCAWPTCPGALHDLETL